MSKSAFYNRRTIVSKNKQSYDREILNVRMERISCETVFFREDIIAKKAAIHGGADKIKRGPRLIYGQLLCVDKCK